MSNLNIPIEQIIENISNNIYEFNWDGYIQSVNIEIKIPDLNNLNYKLWGDWGPCLTFFLEKPNDLLIKYGQSKYRPLTQNYFTLDTPIQPNIREIFPFVFILSDQEKNLDFHVYLDQFFKLGKVDIVRQHDKVNLHQITHQSEKNLTN